MLVAQLRVMNITTYEMIAEEERTNSGCEENIEKVRGEIPQPGSWIHGMRLAIRRLL